MTYTRVAACRLEGLVKKCASCSKDLPDAALHCVFCGAKQAPAPAQAQAGLQKTVMGYSAQEMLAQMKAQGVPPGTPGAPAPQPAPAPALFPQPQAAAPMPARGPLAPGAGSTAPTMFDPNAQARQAQPLAPQPFNANAGAFNAAAPAPSPYQPQGSVDATLPPQGFPQGFNAAAEARAQAQAMGMTPPAQPHGNVNATLPPQGFPQGFNPNAHPAPGPAAPPAGSTPLGAPVFGPSSGPIPSHAGVPASPTPASAPARVAQASGDDPLRGGQRLAAIVFGVFMILAFVLPSAVDPLTFKFGEVGAALDGPLDGILSMLVLPVYGLLALIVGLIPMGTVPRGAILTVLTLGVVGLGLYSLGAFKHLEWQLPALLVGYGLLLTGLVIRGGYMGSLLARVFVTIGVLGFFAPLLVPVEGDIPLVAMFSHIGDVSGVAMVAVIIGILQLVLVVASLLVWLPAPAGGGAKLIYLLFFATMIAQGLLPMLSLMGADIFQSPDELFRWAPLVAVPGLFSYGFGGLLGKITH